MGGRGLIPHSCVCLLPAQGERMLQIREALKILAERVLILETMIGIHGEYLKPRKEIIM